MSVPLSLLILFLPPVKGIAGFLGVFFARTRKGEVISSAVFTVCLTATCLIWLAVYYALKGAGEASSGTGSSSWHSLLLSLFGLPIGIVISLVVVDFKPDTDS